MEYRRGNHRAPAPRRRGAFTLIELLTVVAIIGLLITMVVPTIPAIMRTLTTASTQARINSLTGAARAYKLGQTGNRFYPGQEHAETVLEASGGAYYQAGSAYLASSIFSNADGDFPPPVDRWGCLESDMLDDEEGIDTGVPYTILDTHSHAMALVYFVARKGKEGTLDQFVPTDNYKYTQGNVSTVTTEGNGGGSHTGNIHDYVKGPPDVSGATIVRMDGEFVIHGADPESRMYFEGRLKNWPE